MDDVDSIVVVHCEGVEVSVVYADQPGVYAQSCLHFIHCSNLENISYSIRVYIPSNDDKSFFTSTRGSMPSSLATPINSLSLGASSKATISSAVSAPLARAYKNYHLFSSLSKTTKVVLRRYKSSKIK